MAKARQRSATDPASAEPLKWFHEARYGMIIHWGPYSVAGRGEWVMNRECIPHKDYAEKYARNFKAERYDPAAWAALAREAGMKYMVLTTRHHDGFCLWDTATSDYHAGRLGPGRDLVGPFVEAVRAAGLKVGLYYSVADWRHPDYPGAHERDWPTKWPDPEAWRRFDAYYRSQLAELLTRYGKIDVLWYDGAIPAPPAGAEPVNPWVKSLQPQILINERNGEPFDFRCSEQSLNAKAGAWESCMTLNGNWGYHAGDRDWKSARQVIHMMLTAAKSAGNLLLNIGPRADGTIPDEAVQILRRAGDWLRRNGEFLPNSSRSPFSWNNSSTVTTRGNTVYIHLTHSPGQEYCLTDIANKVLSVRHVDGGKPVRFEQKGRRLFLRDLPCPLPDPIATTLAVEVEGEPRTVAAQTTFWIPG